jgi:putative colanic acid biosynthesis acetyltransferase WcaF
MQTDLSSYNNKWYQPGSRFKRILWYFINCLFFKTGILPISALKIFLLKLFGAKMGRHIIIKPYVNIKYPWFLEIGNEVWIGENVWIDNLGLVKIGNNVCISQGAFIFSGNHNYKKSSFDLLISEIILEDGVWIGAKSIVGPGIICRNHSVLSVGSVATNDLEPFGIYKGNPACKVKERIIQ